MKIIKKLMLLTLIFSFGIAFNACEEESTAPEASDLVPSPVNIQATSNNDSSMFVKFDAPENLNTTLFERYTLRYFVSNNEFVKTIDDPEGGTAYIDGLFRNKAYEVEVFTHYVDKRKSAPVKIEWAPAIRFEQINSSPIRLYASDTPEDIGGNGIDLVESYVDTNENVVWIVETLGTDEIERWHIGFENKSGALKFGAASELDYSGSGSAASAELGPYEVADDFDEVYDSQSLDNISYEKKYYDLNSIELNDKEGVVIYARLPVDGGFKYAKLFVKAHEGEFLQTEKYEDNSGTERELNYIEIEAMVQPATDMPYAKK